MSRPPHARQRILDAAAETVTHSGALAMTLEAVARAAGVSKGGLLYHFPTKDDLIRGLIEDALDRVDRYLEAAVQADTSPGAFTRAYLTTTLADPAATDPLSAGMVAAITSNPELLTPLRDRYRVWQERLDADGLPPGRADLVRLAVDGLWLSALIDLPLPQGQRLQALHQQLAQFTRTDASGPLPDESFVPGADERIGTQPLKWTASGRSVP
jgi:AcrR family transcriptional regulator